MTLVGRTSRSLAPANQRVQPNANGPSENNSFGLRPHPAVSTEMRAPLDTKSVSPPRDDAGRRFTGFDSAPQRQASVSIQHDCARMS